MVIEHVRAHEVEGIRGPSHIPANPHSHDNEEVFFVVSGYGRVRIDDETVEVGPGSCVLVPGGATHCLRNGGHEVLRVLCSAAPAFDQAVFLDSHRLDAQGGTS